MQWQVVGRYVFNDTPTWAEALALLLVLFVTAFGLAVGVRDAGHIGLESMVALLPEHWRTADRDADPRPGRHVRRADGLRRLACGRSAKWGEKKPMLPVPDGIDYVPLVIAGVLIVLFSIEHVIALLRGTEVEPAWN